MDPELEQLLALLAPSFVGDARFPGAITLATAQVAQDHCFRSQVIVLLAAHILASADQGVGGGAITSMKEGGLSITYADAGSGEGLASTGYGKQIQRLNHLCYGMTATTGFM